MISPTWNTIRYIPIIPFITSWENRVGKVKYVVSFFLINGILPFQ